MYLSHLKLQNFRSYPQKTFEFDPEVNLILGPNGSGKTNLLESVFLLSSGKSFRASSLSQLISWDTQFSLVQGQLNKDNQTITLEVQLIRAPENNGHLTRKFYLQKVIKPRKKYLNTLSVVVFHPEDIRLVTSSPTRRRDFLDDLFSSVEWRYAAALSAYLKSLHHRNELLDQIKIEAAQKNELFYWDQSLIKNSDIIHHYRQSFVKHANHYFLSHFHPEIQTLSLNYFPSSLSPERLERQYLSDVDRGFTQSGPHRDDFSFDNSTFFSPDKNLAFWGSRGQQRLAVLALRLAQIDYFEAIYHQKPVLLLDDIFSELDEEHRHLVVDICQKYQTIITSTDMISTPLPPGSHILKL